MVQRVIRQEKTKAEGSCNTGSIPQQQLEVRFLFSFNSIMLANVSFTGYHVYCFLAAPSAASLIGCCGVARKVWP